ncbi:MAG: cadherin-like beta sandwich domain-containing protein [Fibrobacteria bacterium]
MATRFPYFLIACLGASLGLFLSGCQTVDPLPADEVLWLKLNDSLSRYDRVHVQIFDSLSAPVYKLWNAKLPSPGTDLPPYTLGPLSHHRFTIKVSGFKAQEQLALETLIAYDGKGKKTVQHTELPPLRPVNGLLSLIPSSGKLSPNFLRDTLNYKVSLPAGVKSVSFTMQPENPDAMISFEGESVLTGSPTKPVNIGDTPETVQILVTDMSTGVASTRIYSLELFPTLPAGLYLASLQPSAGTLAPDFIPESQVYTLYLPEAIDTVSFVLTPSDLQTMTLLIDHKAIFSGARSKTFTVDSTDVPVPIEVHRGAQLSYYLVTLTHDKPPPSH